MKAAYLCSYLHNLLRRHERLPATCDIHCEACWRMSPIRYATHSCARVMLSLRVIDGIYPTSTRSINRSSTQTSVQSLSRMTRDRESFAFHLLYSDDDA